MEPISMAGGLPDPTPTEAGQRGPDLRRILLVEDNVVNQIVAVKLLNKNGYDVVVACDGKQALELLEVELFDLVLMDLHMPVMDGFEATAAIREREWDRRRLPVIALTANTVQGVRERCLASGFDDFLSKPIRWPSLKAAIEPWVGRSSRREPQGYPNGGPEFAG